MSLLGSVGSLYMVILIMLLIVGLGMIGVGVFRYIFNIGNKGKEKAKSISRKGWGTMETIQNNGWLKLALFALIGIVIAVILQGVIGPGGLFGNSMAGHAGMQGNMNGMFMTTSAMDGMQMPNGMAGMGAMNMGNYSGTAMNYNTALILQRMDMMQVQMNQMQMMMNNGVMNMANMANSGMSNMSGMSGMSGGGMGMMGMTPMGSTGSAMGNMSGGGMGMTMPMGNSSSSMGNMSGGSMGMMDMMPMGSSSSSMGSTSGGGMSMM